MRIMMIMRRGEFMRVAVDSETIRNLLFLMLIDKYKIPEILAKEIALDVERLIKNNEDD